MQESSNGKVSRQQRHKEIQDQAPQVLDRYLNGHATVHQLVKEFGISETAVYRLLYRSGITPKGPHSGGGPKLFTPEQDRCIAAEYEAGASMESLATKYGCWRTSIKNTLKRVGVMSRGNRGRPKTWPDGFPEQLLAEWNTGMSQKAIGEKHGLSEMQVYGLLRRFPAGTATKIRRRGWHPHWKGGRMIHQGYVLVLLEADHPFACMANQMGYVLEHRLVMAQSLGRPLMATETVHHKDGNRSNNTIENLQLRQGKHGAGVVYRCADCGSCNVVADMLAGEDEAHTPDGPPVAQADRQHEARPLPENQASLILPQLTLDLQ